MRRTAIALTVALIVLCVAWEAWLAPVRPGGWTLALKALPLALLLPGLLADRLRSWQWMSMVVLAYVGEGLVRVTSDPGRSVTLAAVELALAIPLFLLVLLICRQARSRIGPASD